MKVLHVVPTYWPATRYGGPIYSVHGLCAALAKNDTSVTVFTTSVDGAKNSDVNHGELYKKDGVKVFYYESKYLRRIYFSSQFKHALEKVITEFDLVHLHSIFLYPTNIAARIAVKNKIPYVISPRGMLEKKLVKSKSSTVKNIWLKMFEKKTLEQANLIHLTSDREHEELVKFDYSFPKTIVIPNGVDAKLIADGKNLEGSSTFQILFIGRINWKKRIDKLIESIKYLSFELKLIIAGNDEDEYKDQLSKLIKDIGIDERANISIEFVGEKHDEEKHNLFLESDVMVLPSLSENFGNTVIEAMAAGCPVIVTPEVGASEVVKKAKAGLMTNGTPQDIAKQITYIKENPEDAMQMSKSGIKAVRLNYQWSNIADSMTKAYKELVSVNG